MLNYTIRRLLLLIPLLFFISVMIFGILKLTPGDPAVVLLGERATEEALELTREKYALNSPFYVQYVKMMGNFFTGELKSIYYKENVIMVVLKKMIPTLELGLTALMLAIAVSIPAGIISSVKRNSIFDYTSMTTALFGISIPVFFTGILLIYLFAVKLKVLPASGYGGSMFTIEGLRHLVMPAFVLSFTMMASTTRITRSSMLDLLQEDYIRTARAKGVKENQVILKHAFKNALMPIATNVGNQIARLFAGAVLTETVFAWPGVGRLAVNAIFRRDEPLVFGCVLILSVIYVVVNLMVDLFYGIINPRIRYE
ncbi:dipeptide transporter; membrane component of ABC superfamily [Desulfamplus magnetovallimortis]|uniref:Dipeptide transporter membrane component of ABC superfamily n=1 Tax=Desulfamplus magnetovallimortis TaxID=1246637 RepID=A0A1W1HIL6_9BACT|nr:ABC transporter permease [Desulfamplus magnetovallimortis]SLM32218.1 dipeptide transporter; membrane component of ABC superfamily [Desulfamplus magnetovallimortis]